MQKFGRIILGSCITFIVASCAQVGTITGGSRDFYAPKPIKEKVSPSNATTNITPTQIEIPFNEFIKLKNPLQTITVTPNTLKVDASIVRKTLVLKLEGEYLPNTTYSIMFNKTVQDITEGNDSLFYYVFSTGTEIDKYQASFTIQDAFTNKPIKDISVGLFEKEILEDSIETPIYLSNSNSLGEVYFSYLKSQNYFVYAYDDLNQNGRIDKGEDAGRIETSYLVKDTLLLDSVPNIKVNQQKQMFQVNTEYVAPSIWKIYATEKIDTSVVRFIGAQPKFIRHNAEGDTLYSYFDMKEVDRFRLIYQGDTLSKRPNKSDVKTLTVSNNLIKNKVPFQEDFKLNFNDVLSSYGYSGILINNTPLSIQKGKIIEQPNEPTFNLDLSSYKDSVAITILPNTFNFYNTFQTDTLTYKVVKQTSKDVGNLIVTADSLFPNGIVQLIYNNNVIAEKLTTINTESITFNALQPNLYSFRFIYDTNQDAKWTKGDVYKNTMPEKVVWFNSTSKVRANWDVEATLSF